MYWKNQTQGSDSVKVEDFSTIKTKEVYLPAGANWFDFWTNEQFTGGQKIKKEVPLDIIPLYVKAGTILPIGPKVQFAAEKKWDNMEIRIYPGADGNFTLYEDENDNYNYEKGNYSTINFKWNNQDKKLTIEKRHGSFDGMLVNRTFSIVLMTKNGKPDESAHRKVDYSGNKVTIKL
jgi:alpha-D-xyloside xylohydrolase